MARVHSFLGKGTHLVLLCSQTMTGVWLVYLSFPLYIHSLHQTKPWYLKSENLREPDILGPWVIAINQVCSFEWLLDWSQASAWSRNLRHPEVLGAQAGNLLVGIAGGGAQHMGNLSFLQVAGKYFPPSIVRKWGWIPAFCNTTKQKEIFGMFLVPEMFGSLVQCLYNLH